VACLNFAVFNLCFILIGVDTLFLVSLAFKQQSIGVLTTPYRFMKRILFLTLTLLALLGNHATAQTEGKRDPRLYQLSGMVLARSSAELQPVVYTTIRVNHTRRIAMSNAEGFFSMPVTASDTLFFYRVGFKPTFLLVDRIVSRYADQDSVSPYLYELVYMRDDSISLPTVLITPYDSPDKLRAAILNMGIDPNDPARLASNNLTDEIRQFYTLNLPKDAKDRENVSRQLYYDRMQAQTTRPSIGVDPIAAYRMIRYMANKAKEKKNKNYNYWPD
jgi:hypothetical protein